MNPSNTWARIYLVTLTAIGAITVAIGIWCLVDPGSFAESVGFDVNEHFLHDIGAFQLGLGVTLLFALIWSDALATAIAGFIVANTVATVNDVLDLDFGGSAAQAWLSARSRWRWWRRSSCGCASSATSWAPPRPRPARRWPCSSARRPSGSPHSERTELPAPVRSASWSTEIARIFGASSGQSKYGGSSATRASSSGRRRCRASQPAACDPAEYVCWTEPSIGQQLACFGASIPSCMACWCR